MIRIAAAFLVPALGAVLATTAIASTFLLHQHEDTYRTRELTILDIRAQFNALQNMPWDKRRLSQALPRGEEKLDKALVRAGLGSLVPQVATNVSVLTGIDAYVTAGDTTGASVLAGKARRLAQPVLQRLDVASGSATSAARHADLEASVGSTVAIALLLGGFWLLHLRLRRAHSDERSRRTWLERAQADRMALLASTVEGADEERRRIAADLHDGPIQRLTATAFALDLLANRVARGELESVDDDLRQVRQALAGQMRSLRRMMTELLPPVLDEGGVAAAISNRAVQVLGLDANVAVHDHTAGARFAPELETAVYRVAGEALANAAKHARASRVDVFLHHRGDRLRLAVVDDGIGFDPSAAARLEDHLGMKAMRERIESVGGTLQIISSPGQGTRIEAYVAWRARAKEQRAVA